MGWVGANSFAQKREVKHAQREDREARLKGLENGAEEFLTKPVGRTELQMRVKSLLKEKLNHE